ncbi:hypothetical protein Hdeb2414_s0143g00812011 [Helianthus debilis subsp. tardiflorus]
MLPINLTGPMNLLPMNFIFDSITKTHSRYIIILGTSILNRNRTNLSQLLIRSFRCYMIGFTKYSFQTSTHQLLELLTITKFFAKIFFGGSSFSQGPPKFIIPCLMKRTYFLLKTLFLHQFTKTHRQEDFMGTDHPRIT